MKDLGLVGVIFSLGAVQRFVAYSSAWGGEAMKFIGVRMETIVLLLAC